jgi:hypothetical protein
MRIFFLELFCYLRRRTALLFGGVRRNDRIFIRARSPFTLLQYGIIQAPK